MGWVWNLFNQGAASDPSNPGQGVVNELDGVNAIRDGYQTDNTQEMQQGIAQFGLTFSRFAELGVSDLTLDGAESSLSDPSLYAGVKAGTRFPGDDFKGVGPKLRMTRSSIDQTASKYGIDLHGYGNICIMLNWVGMRGETLPNGQILLARGAFVNEQVLARTLVDEMYHVDQLRAGMAFPVGGQSTDPWEAPAYAHEQQWWEGVSGG